MVIRPAQVRDLSIIEAIVESAYGVYVERIGRRPMPMDDDYAAKVRDGVVFVADDSGVVGLVVLIPAPDHLLIENVAVAPGRQRAGLGRRLLAFAEEQARGRHLSMLKLYTNAAMTENIELYRRLGYLEDGRQTQDGFGRVFFSKRLERAGAAGERALVLAGAGSTGNAWEIGVIAGLFEAGLDVPRPT